MKEQLDEEEYGVILGEWDKSAEKRLLGSCKLCPRACGVDRLNGGCGFCKAGSYDKLRISRAAPHYWEEPCISGEQSEGKGGSGAVFFSFCTLGCVFCQNRKISRPECAELTGVEIDVAQLVGIFLALESVGVFNINLVTPTHYIPQIIFAVRIARRYGLQIPIVYNTSGYERIEVLKLLEGTVDIYLPDFKYIDRDIAKKYSGAENYPDVIIPVLDEMLRQTGVPVFEDGLLKKGTMVRHLVLPGCAIDARRILKLLHERYGENIIISIMNQYTPPSDPKEFAEKYPELSSPLPEHVYSRIVKYAEKIGIDSAYIQEGGTVSESFIPDFDSGDGVSELVKP